MTDHEIDTLVALRNPIDERALQALELDGEELRLCDLLMQAGGEAAAAPAVAQPHAEPHPHPQAPRSARRMRRAGPHARLLAGITFVAVLAAVAILALSGREPGSSGTAWAAPLVRLAESSPLLLLDEPGWTVTRADETDEVEGEMTFSRDAGSPDALAVTATRSSATLHWRRGPIEMWRRDRAHDAPLVTHRTVLGERAQVTRYADSTDFTAIWPDGERVLEFRSVAPDLAAFERRLAALQRVDVDAWLTAMPASVIKSADRSAVVDEMLTGIPLPPGFDRTKLTSTPTVSDRYQLGAKVTGAVACAWIARWAAAREQGDSATVREAVAAMQTSHDWKILGEMRSAGAWSQVLWSRADAMRDGGAGINGSLTRDVRSSLGCGRGR